MTKRKIPKILHYIWLGNTPKPKKVLDCIKSWRKFCPDYKIKEWNDEILKEINNQYAHDAYQVKKYAFASDYIRLYVLNKYGGIYLDTDVELTQSLDKFLNDEFFIGHHKENNTISIATNLIGANKNNQIILYLIEEYNNLEFITKDGKYNMLPNPFYFKNIFDHKLGCKLTNGENTIELMEDCKIYPWYFFCKAKINKENYAIHHCFRSWHKENLSIKNWCFSLHQYSTTHRLIILFGFKIKIKHKNKD